MQGIKFYYYTVMDTLAFVDEEKQVVFISCHDPNRLVPSSFSAEDIETKTYIFEYIGEL